MYTSKDTGCQLELAFRLTRSACLAYAVSRNARDGLAAADEVSGPILIYSRGDSNLMNKNSIRESWRTALLAALMLATGTSFAQSDGGYGLKVFRADASLYPFVQVYLRTFDREMNPLVNLNELNVGVMVDGRSYDPMKRQYVVQTVANRNDAVRAVFVIDTSASMQGAAFNGALEAAARFIDAKRSQDQVAVIALDDSSTGYRVVSGFERDRGALARRLADLDADTSTSRLYDATGAAMAMSASAGQGQPGQVANTASTSIIVFSDGKDEGSALVRSDLMNRIGALGIPVPIYSLGYNTGDAAHLLNLDALSRASFGSYTDVSDNPGRMTPIVEGLHRTMQNDYVVTFRSYVPVDGAAHNLKVGLEYPSGSGQLQYQSTTFEAISPPPVPAITEARRMLDQRIPAVDSPYLEDPMAQSNP